MARSTRKYRGAGYQTSQQFFDPTVLPPHVSLNSPVVSTMPTDSAIRPVLLSTFKGGKRTRRRGTKGGFNPSVMGPFVANVQTAIAPLAMYSTYRVFNGKASAKKSRSSRKSRSRSPKTKRGGRR